MSRAERRELRRASEVGGLEDEISLLRVYLKRLAEGQTNKRTLREINAMNDTVMVMLKAVAVQYRLSPRATKDLSDALVRVLNGLGDQILPAEG
jgi:hypothetical protein